MDFYNRHFHRMIRHLDPDGMLNVPLNVYNNKYCLDRYFRTNADFQRLNVPWMCDQLMILLSNFEDLATFLSTKFLQNDFQRIKYSLMLIDQAFIGLISIHDNSINAYYSYCINSTNALYKNKKTLDKVTRKKKRKTNISDQTYQEGVIQTEKIGTMCQIKVITSGFDTNETNINETDSILNHPRQAAELNIPEIMIGHHNVSNIPIIYNQNNTSNMNNDEIINGIYKQSNLEEQHIKEFQLSNQIQHYSKNEIGQNLMDIDFVQPQNIEQLQLIEPPQYTINERNILTEQIIEPQSKNVQDQVPNQITTEENFLQNNEKLKRKRSKNKALHKNFKKRPIEQNSKRIKTRLRKLEGPLPDRPLECMAMKYIQQTMNHLSLRHTMYHNKLNISFVSLTLNIELEEYKNQDDVKNKELTMNSYKALTEKLNNSNISNCCIYQQCMNNALPHLSLLPIPEEYLSNNSLVWRDTINEINKKMGESLKDILSISKTDQNKWEEFKEKMKQKVNQSLVPNKTLIAPELSHVHEPEPLILLPSSQQINELLNGNSIIENLNSIQANNVCHMPFPNIEDRLPTILSPVKLLCNSINTEQDMNKFEQDEYNNQKIVEPVEQVCHEKSIDIMQMISNSFQKLPKNNSSLIFTDLCPTRVSNRKYVIQVFVQLLRLHKSGIVKLSQSYSMIDPSSISIELNIENF